MTIDLPPEVIDKLTNTDHSWLTQPVATVLAASIALLAAAVAWLSVRRQVNAEDRRVRETSRLDLMSEALSASMTLLDAARKRAEFNSKIGSKMVEEIGPSSPKAAYQAAVTEALLARHKLEVIGGVAASAAAMHAFQNGVAAHAQGKADLKSTFALLDKMHEAFKQDIAALEK